MKDLKRVTRWDVVDEIPILYSDGFTFLSSGERIETGGIEFKSCVIEKMSR